MRIDIAEDLAVGLDNLLDLHIDEEVERVDMLFDETFDLEEGGKEIPFILMARQASNGEIWSRRCAGGIETTHPRRIDRIG